MSKPDLIAAAKARGLDVKSSMTVKDLEALLAADPNEASRKASPSNPCPRCGRMNPHVHNA